MADIEMPHWGHDEHLCLLMNIGYYRVRKEDYKNFVREGRYICKECGRAAAEERHLCSPEKL